MVQGQSSQVNTRVRRHTPTTREPEQGLSRPPIPDATSDLQVAQDSKQPTEQRGESETSPTESSRVSLAYPLKVF